MSAGEHERWRWADTQGVQRRVRLDELRAALASGTLPPYTLVWRPGMSEWVPAYQAGELATMAIAAQHGIVPNVPPPPLAVVAAQAEFEGRDDGGAREEEPPPPPVQKYAALAAQMSGLLTRKAPAAKAPPPPPPPAHMPPPPAPVAAAAPTPTPAPAPALAPAPEPQPAASPAPAALPTMVGFAAPSVSVGATNPDPAPGPPPAPTPPAPAAVPPPPPATHKPSVPPPPPSRRASAPAPRARPDATLLGVAPQVIASAPPPPQVESERSESALPSFALDDDDVPLARPAAAPAAAPATPVTRPVGGVPLRLPQQKWFLPAVAGLGAVVGIGLIGFVIAGVGHGSKDGAATSSSASASPAQSAVPAAAAAPAAPAAAHERAAMAACRRVGEPSRVAAKAFRDAPIELLPSDDGARVWLGYAADAHAAHGVVIDTATLAIKPEVNARSAGAIRGVVPLPSAAGAAFIVDADGKGDALAGWRAIAAEPAAVVGLAQGALALGAKATDAPAALWPLGGDGALEALRSVYVPDVGFALAFRRGGKIFGAWLDPSRAPKGGVVEVAGAGAPPGSPVGAPTLASNHRDLAVAFADRASSSAPWSIRLGRAALGSFPSATTSFSVPAGGPGGPAIAPALAGLADGRFLLVWTEGSGHDHDVRAQTLSPDLSPLGEAFTVSQPGANAGQGAVAIAGRRGVVSYLATAGKGYDLRVASIECP